MTDAAAHKELVKEASRSAFTEDQLIEISNAEDVKAALADHGVEIESWDDYGTGFNVVDKSRLVGVPFRILEWKENDGGDYGTFVSVLLVTGNNEKIVINDGSTGVAEQLHKVAERRIAKGRALPFAGLDVPRGLRVSEYDKEIDGKITKARTYYLG